MQLDTGTLAELKQVGVVPGGKIEVCAMSDRNAGIEIKGAGNVTRIQPAVAHAVLVHAR